MAYGQGFVIKSYVSWTMPATSLFSVHTSSNVIKPTHEHSWYTAVDIVSKGIVKLTRIQLLHRKPALSTISMPGIDTRCCAVSFLGVFFRLARWLPCGQMAHQCHMPGTLAEHRVHLTHR